MTKEEIIKKIEEECREINREIDALDYKVDELLNMRGKLRAEQSKLEQGQGASVITLAECGLSSIIEDAFDNEIFGN